MIIIIRLVGETSIIAGRVVEETDTHFILSYPGVANTIPTEDGFETIVMPLVPPIVQNHLSLMSKFKINKNIILFYGELNKEWHNAYEQFEARITASITGTNDKTKLH